MNIINWKLIFDLVEAGQKLLMSIALLAGIILMILAVRRLREMSYSGFKANQGYTMGGTVMTFFVGLYFCYLPVAMLGIGQDILGVSGLGYIKEPTGGSEAKMAMMAVRRMIQLLGVWAIYKGGQHAKAVGDNGLKHHNPNESSPLQKCAGFTVGGLACLFHADVAKGLQELTPFNPFGAFLENL